MKANGTITFARSALSETLNCDASILLIVHICRRTCHESLDAEPAAPPSASLSPDTEQRSWESPKERDWSGLGCH